MRKSRLWKVLTALSMLIGLSIVGNSPKVVQAADINYSYTFAKSADGGKVLGGASKTATATLDGHVWTATSTGGNLSDNYDSTVSSDKGKQFGTSNNPCTTLNISSSQTYENVSYIFIETSGASSINASMDMKVGESVVKTVSITKDKTKYDISLSSPLNGKVSFYWTNSSEKAIYVKSFGFTYGSTGTNPDPDPDPDPDPEIPEKSVTLTAASNSLNVTATSYPTGDFERETESITYVLNRFILNKSTDYNGCLQVNNSYIYNKTPFPNDILRVEVDVAGGSGTLTGYFEDNLDGAQLWSNYVTAVKSGNVSTFTPVNTTGIRHFKLMQSSNAAYFRSITIVYVDGTTPSTPVPSVSIDFESGNNATVKEGYTTKLVATPKNLEVGQTISWHATSVDTTDDVVSVDSNGLVTALNPGSANVYAQIDGTEIKSNNILITVEPDYTLTPVEVATNQILELTTTVLSLSGSGYGGNNSGDITVSGQTVGNGAVYSRNQISVSNGIQFQATNGLLFNRTPYTRNITSIELDFEGNTSRGAAKVNFGTQENPTGDSVDAVEVGNIRVYRPLADATYFSINALATMQVRTIRIYFAERSIVNFELDGGDLVDDTPSILVVNTGTQITIPDATKYGFILEGWMDDVVGEILASGDLYTVTQDTCIEVFWEAVIPEQLATPVVTEMPIYDNGFTLSWEANEHAMSYQVAVLGEDYLDEMEVSSPSVALTTLSDGEYLVTLKAIGDKVYYNDSEELEVEINILVPAEVKVTTLDTMASLSFGFTSSSGIVDAATEFVRQGTGTITGIKTGAYFTGFMSPEAAEIFTMQAFRNSYGANDSVDAVGINKDDGLRLYASNSDGSSVVVSSESACVQSITIYYTTETYSGVTVSVDNVVVSRTGEYDTKNNKDTYTFGENVNAFTLQSKGINAVRIKKIEVSYEISSVVYDFNEVKIRFGCTIAADIYDNLDNVTGFGIEVSKEGNENVLDITNATLVHNSDGTYSFAGVLKNIPLTKDGLTSMLTARCYVIVDGTKVYLKEKAVSVESIIDLYLTEDFGFSDEEKSILKGMQAFIAALEKEAN